MDLFFEAIPGRLKNFFKDIDPKKIWRVLPLLEDCIAKEIIPRQAGVIRGDVLIDSNVEIGEGTTIEHGAVIKGPTIIGKHCEIRSGAYIRGGVITGDGCVIGHTTELVRCVLFSGVRLDHFNYVADSVLGNRVHFGAGAKVANLRFDGKEIAVEGVDTGIKKFGVIMGDRAQIGVNAIIGPGVLLEKDVWLTAPCQIPSGKYSRVQVRELTKPFTLTIK
jgi:NDP-sugar pyrophosphorylase family protein